MQGKLTLHIFKRIKKFHVIGFQLDIGTIIFPFRCSNIDLGWHENDPCLILSFASW